MNRAKKLVKVIGKTRLLTAAEFQHLADVPPEVEWFRNIRNPHTKRAYENAIKDFMLFTGIKRPEEFRTVTRAHVIAWRDDLGNRALIGTSIRHRLAALSSLFQYLCDENAVTHNPVKGVKRPKVESDQGKTPANRRSSGPQTARGASRENAQRHAGPGHSGHSPLSCPPARGVMQAQGEGF